jgi:hypothetical protein
MTRRTLPLIIAALALLLPGTARASFDQESTFQDDNELLYQDASEQRSTLDELEKLGVDRIRVTVKWRDLAPSKRPKNFDGADPDSYGGAWESLDTLIREAYQRGIGMNFNVTGPSPDWANRKAPRKDIQDTYEPSPRAFGQFVQAVGTRYSGEYPDDQGGLLPRADYWSLWNEPNHSGWLTPTWQRKGNGPWFERSAALYRSLADAAYAGLVATGHGKDTIVFGETAPAGSDTSRDIKRFMTPLRFIRALYCVDQHQRRLKGAAARRLRCPKSAKDFVVKHPVLFEATGYAHHPYDLLFGPRHQPTNPNYVTIGNLHKLEHVLDVIQRRYGSHKRFPLYLTEFGYQTRPPDPQGVNLRKQGEFINLAEYIAARDPRVRTLSQFLLRDDGPPIGLTFQTGLRTRSGSRKPAYDAYRLPLWVSGKGARKRIWGVARPTTSNEIATVAVQFRREGSKDWQTLRRVRSRGDHNVVRTTVTARGKGAIRLVDGKLRSRRAKVG